VPFLSLLPALSGLAEPANLAGLLALGSSLTWPLLRNRRVILGVQVVGSLLFAVHYLLLGAPTAAAMCATGALQGLALVLLVDRRKRIGVVGVTLAASAMVTALTWMGVPSLLSLAGQVMSGLGRLQVNTQRLRQCFLISVLFWTSHNLMVGSVFGLASDALSITSLILGLWRNRDTAHGSEFKRAAA
jgi:hypothetical protein